MPGWMRKKIMVETSLKDLGMMIEKLCNLSKQWIDYPQTEGRGTIFFTVGKLKIVGSNNQTEYETSLQLHMLIIENVWWKSTFF